MTLYEIRDDISKVLDGTVNEETGEWTVDYDKLADLKIAETEKIENTIKYYLSIDGDIEKFTAEIKKLSAKKKQLETRKGSLKNYLDMIHNKVPAEYGVHTIKYRKSSKLNDGNIDLLPEAFTNTGEITANKKDIKAWLEEGHKLESWKVIERQNIQIK